MAALISRFWGGVGGGVVVVVKLTDRLQGSGWRDHVGQGRQWPVSGGDTEGVGGGLCVVFGLSADPIVALG
jgi:hypothetical protein